MADWNEFQVVLDLGTSKITALAGVKSGVSLKVIALETVASENCIRRGVVHNVDETALRIKKVIQSLSAKLNAEIDTVYVGVSGQSITAVDNHISREMGANEEIDTHTLRNLKAENFDYRLPEEYEILDVLEQEILVDGTTEPNPVGVTCKTVEGRYKLIVGRATLQQNIKKVFSKLDYKPIFLVSQKAAAEALLTDHEKQLGCALVDFGAGKTAVSIYKENKLYHMAIIPFGGENINTDMKNYLQLLPSETEQLKLRYANVLPTDRDAQSEIPLEKKDGLDDRKVDGLKFYNCVGARVEELVSNIVYQIQSAKVGPLTQGIVVTGAASKLGGLVEFLKKKSEMEVRVAATYRKLDAASQQAYHYPEYAVAVGLLLLGDKNCKKITEATLFPETTQFNEPIVEDKPQPAEEVVEDNTKGKKSKKAAKPSRASWLDKLTERFFGDI